MQAAATKDLQSLEAWIRNRPDCCRKIPSDSGRKAALARELSHRLSSPCLIVVNETGIWPSAECKPLFAALRQSLGARGTLQDLPGHLVEELIDIDGLFALLACIFYFCWGALIVESEGLSAWRITHDEFIEFRSVDPRMSQEVKEFFAHVGMSPDAA